MRPEYWRGHETGGEIKSIRNLAFATNGEVFTKKIKPNKDGYQVEFIVQAGEDTAITLHISPEMNLWHPVLPFSESSKAAEIRWRNWVDQIPKVMDQYRLKYAYAWWTMANNLVSPMGKVAYEAMMPSKNMYIGLWLRDYALHALAHQLPDGILPDAIFDDGIVAEIDHPIRAEVTKPPILAWAALKIHEIAPDVEFLKEIYVPLVRWNAWWFSMNDDDVDGLVQYNHPYSSGLDDSPLWDQGMPVASPDLNTYLCIQMGSLARMAEILEMPDEAQMWRRRAAGIVKCMIEDFCDEAAGIFRALYENRPISTVTPFNLCPLWTGQLPDAIRSTLLDHLTNPNEFWGEFALPTVARSDPAYNPETMWRGPVWANINYFFIEVLQQIREFDVARELREKTLQMIIAQPGMYEYYHVETSAPPPKAAPTFGWTAAVFIDLAIQASREGGIDANVPQEEKKGHSVPCQWSLPKVYDYGQKRGYKCDW